MNKNLFYEPNTCFSTKSPNMSLHSIHQSNIINLKIPDKLITVCQVTNMGSLIDMDAESRNGGTCSNSGLVCDNLFHTNISWES